MSNIINIEYMTKNPVLTRHFIDTINKLVEESETDVDIINFGIKIVLVGLDYANSKNKIDIDETTENIGKFINAAYKEMSK